MKIINSIELLSLESVVDMYMGDERKSAEEDINEDDIVNNFSMLTDDEFYATYSVKYTHIWFDLYRLNCVLTMSPNI